LSTISLSAFVHLHLESGKDIFLKQLSESWRQPFSERSHTMRIKKIAIFFVLLFFAALPAQAGNKRVILCSTYPIFQITRNVVVGMNSVDVQLLIPAALGCPHDYALTPQDMGKLNEADILIVNGLGMEEFLGTPVEKANPRIKVIDSSVGIKEILSYVGHDDEHEDNDHDADHDGDHHEEGDEDGHDHDHEHSGTNPHLFASPRMVSLLAMNIAGELSKLDPNAAGTYFTNAKGYAGKMNALAEEFMTLGKRLKNNRIVTQHGVFDYLARDMGLEIVAVVQEHGGREPSAADMLAIVKTVKEKKAGAIFTEPQYPAKVGHTIAREAGIVTATLDPVANGPEGAPLDYYETVMRQNLLTLEKTLGTK
jgi:zinc transport system substrate-binding protein